MKKIYLFLLILVMNINTISKAENITLICVIDDGKDRGVSKKYILNTFKKEIFYTSSKVTKKYKERENQIEWRVVTDVGNLKTEYFITIDRFTGKKNVLWRPVNKKKQKKLGLNAGEFKFWTETCKLGAKNMF
jgi:hypothetical protein